MSLCGDMSGITDIDLIFKALADSTRRAVLDLLAEGPKTTGELVDNFPDLSRTGVMKHLDLLVRVDLVQVRRAGRQRWNHINPMPIQRIYDRWVSRHVRGLAGAMSRFKDHVEADPSVKRPKKL